MARSTEAMRLLAEYQRDQAELQRQVGQVATDAAALDSLFAGMVGEELLMSGEVVSVGFRVKDRYDYRNSGKMAEVFMERPLRPDAYAIQPDTAKFAGRLVVTGPQDITAKRLLVVPYDSSFMIFDPLRLQAAQRRYDKKYNI